MKYETKGANNKGFMSRGDGVNNLTQIRPPVQKQLGVLCVEVGFWNHLII